MNELKTSVFQCSRTISNWHRFNLYFEVIFSFLSLLHDSQIQFKTTIAPMFHCKVLQLTKVYVVTLKETNNL